MDEIEKQPIEIKAIGNIRAIDQAQWNACAGSVNPFVRHEFLSALEASKSATAETGWGPHHIVIEDSSGQVLGAAPMYLKGHSYGEYIFDHAWAHAFERAGGNYYPKLLIGVPFTPVTGPRLLVPENCDLAETQQTLVAAAIEVAKKLEVSSLHINFPTTEEWNRLGSFGLMLRTGEQFHWINQGYTTFDEFLSDLASRKRKAIKKERREAVANGIEIEVITGSDLTEAHWDAFFEFYLDTSARKWGSPYLNRTFFSLVGEVMADRISLVMARRDGRYVAGALNFVGSDTIYGRYWGAREHHPFLHFEICYYQAIQLAIAHRLKRVEAGAQGPHKLTRGYMPAHTYSAHWVRNPSFRDAIANYLEQERTEVDAEINYLKHHSPFRKP
tara:strand:+ start:57 stop:1217 length:1161 start_codon:yes stop_codon:yes gene_type:complete